MKPLLLAAACIAAAAPIGPARAQSVGAPFGAREPRACPPSSGVERPDQALATALVVCAKEHTYGDQLYLVGGLTVEIGGSRRYSQFSDGYSTGIDTDAPVYPIRGGVVEYQCDRVYTDASNKGANCRAYSYPHASGTCFRTTFGDWTCNMLDTSVISPYKRDLPPPG